MQENEHFPAQEETLHEEVVQASHPSEQIDQPQQTLPEQENSSARNFRQLREKAERTERELHEAQQYIRNMQSKPQEDEDDGLADDDLVERKHVDRIVDKKIKKYEQQLQQYQMMQQEQQVLNQCKDYYSVVTDESIAMLQEQEPEIAATIGSNPDLRSKAIATYNIIKKLGINNTSAQSAPYAQDIQRIKANAAKPKPLASVNPQQGDSPLSRANAFANGLTDDLKEQLRKEMNDSRRGY